MHSGNLCIDDVGVECAHRDSLRDEPSAEMGALEMGPILRADPKTATIPLIAVGGGGDQALLEASPRRLRRLLGPPPSGFGISGAR